MSTEEMSLGVCLTWGQNFNFPYYEAEKTHILRFYRPF
jgi:hypothetical protein